MQQIAEGRQVPGVGAVSLASMPMDGTGGGAPIFVERPVAGTSHTPGEADRTWVFEAMGTPLIAGRAMTWTDIRQLTRVAWISEIWRANTGRNLRRRSASASGLPGQWLEIAGVTGDVREGAESAYADDHYTHLAVASSWPDTRVKSFRSHRVGTSGFVHELQRAVWSASPDLALAHIRTLSGFRPRQCPRRRSPWSCWRCGRRGAAARAGQRLWRRFVSPERTHDRHRMALGAQSRDVRRLFLQHGLALALTASHRVSALPSC